VGTEDVGLDVAEPEDEDDALEEAEDEDALDEVEA